MDATLGNKLRRCLGAARKHVAYLATVDVDAGHAPEVRPVSLMERDWRFYIATRADSRKAREMSEHPKAAALVHFRDEKHSGYLRLTGGVEKVDDASLRREVVEASKYPITHLGTGADDPAVFFARIVPYRIEFMEPGEETAVDVTSSFPR